MSVKRNPERKKKKRRRYRLVIPGQTSTSSRKPAAVRKAPVKKKKRVRRHLRKEIWFVLAGIAAVLLMIYVPRIRQSNALKKLGYSKEAITAIRKDNLADTLLENQYYSDYLQSSILDGTLNTDYLDLYTVASADRGLDARDFLIARRLSDKGYEADQIQNLFKDLEWWEITPLLVFDYQPIETNYIDDVISHRDTNSRTNFVLSGTYYTPYGNTKAADSSSVTMLVSKTYYLDQSYSPAGLTELSSYYAASGQQLAAEAASAMQAWGDAGRAVNVYFYASSAYRSFESQENVYNNYVLAYGEDGADALSARPGFSEHQTGLTVDLAATGDDEGLEFKDTAAYQWTSTNSQDYGWILRYPEGKESITGYEFESWHYRYVGIEIAQAVYNSQLTYDEFWMLYLAPWESADNKPSDAVLNAASYKVYYLGQSAELSAASASPSADSSASPSSN